MSFITKRKELEKGKTINDTNSERKYEGAPVLDQAVPYLIFIILRGGWGESLEPLRKSTLFCQNCLRTTKV